MFKIAWSKNGTPDTLSGTAGSVDISDLTAKTFNQFLYHQPTSAGTAGGVMTFDGVTATDYAYRYSQNGGADATAASQANIAVNYGTNADDEFVVLYCINISSEEKLVISQDVSRGSSGAAAAPNRKETVGKFDTTTSSGQITQITISDTSGTDLPADTNLSALGTD